MVLTRTILLDFLKRKYSKTTMLKTVDIEVNQMSLGVSTESTNKSDEIKGVMRRNTKIT